MANAARPRMVNPRLGTYFSIFASLFAALFLLALIAEQLQVTDGAVRLALFCLPVLLYVAIGFSVASNDPLEFFAAGRRVPAGYTGLVLALSALGATMVVAGTGVFFLSGFDALVLMIGGLSGFVMMAMLLAPFYRKFGAFTVPSFLGRRFENKAIRLTAAGIAAVTLLLVLAAEFHIGAVVASRLTGYRSGPMMLALIFAVAISLAPGGKRALTWSGSAQAIAVILALAITAATVAVIVTNLPVPQLTHGPLVRGLVRNETALGLQLVNAPALAFGLPGEGLQPIAKPYAAPFGSVGPLAFVIGTIMIAAGTAAAPWLLPRVAATPGVYEARKSLGWATVFFGVTMLTLSSVAVFMRDYVLDLIMSPQLGPPPAWVTSLVNLGYIELVKNSPRFAFDSVAFDRDAVLFALPIAAGLPVVFSYLALAGAVAAALLAASATTVSLAAILSEDVVQGLSWEPAAPAQRIWTARVFIAISAIAGGLLAIIAPTDPLRLLLWALGLSAATFFPVMVLAVWWKRITGGGAMLGLLSGFVVAALSILASEAGLLPIPSAIAAIVGLPIAVGATLAGSLMRPENSRHGVEVVRDIRIPGGEIIYDREMQRLHLKKHVKG